MVVIVLGCCCWDLKVKGKRKMKMFMILCHVNIFEEDEALTRRCL